MTPTAAFYQLQFYRHPEAARYLEQRGLRDSALIEEPGIGYAPGGNLRRHLAASGYSFDLLLQIGLINSQMLYVQLAPEDVWREYACAVGKRTRLGSSQIL